MVEVKVKIKITWNKIEQKCKKKFYVSPFMDMDTYYNFKLLNPNEKLSISIKQTDKEDIVLTAVQTETWYQQANSKSWETL